MLGEHAKGIMALVFVWGVGAGEAHKQCHERLVMVIFSV